MRRLRFLPLALAALLADGASGIGSAALRGQELIGLNFLPGETTVTVVSIDPATGAQTPLVHTSATGFAGGYLAVDPATRRVFFEDPFSLSLYTANLSQGTESHVPMALCCTSLGWDAGGHRLVGLTFLPGETTVTVVGIDPSTGAQAPLVPTTATGSAGGYVTIDPATRRLFFEDPFSLSLYTVNLSHGSESHVPMALCCPSLEWDAGGQLLVGLNFLPGETTVTVFGIDPTTGAQTPLVPTTSTGLAGGYVAIDPATRRLFFEDGFSLALHTVNLSQGTESHVPMALCCPPLAWLAGGQTQAVPLDARALAVLAAALAAVGWKLAATRIRAG